MFITKKIFFRVALLSGVGYVIFKNKDKIFGKISKLSRMGTVDEMVDDVGMSASKALDGTVDLVEEVFDYISTFGEEEAERPNEALERDLKNEIDDLPINKGFQLRNSASKLVSNIRGWNNPNYETSNVIEKGKMPIGDFISWHNFLTMKDSEDFMRVVKMANIMLQYNAPYNVNSDTVRDLNSPTIDVYVDSPPSKYTQLNDIEWSVWGDRPKMYFSLKPISLFRVVGDRIRNESNKDSVETRGNTILGGGQVFVHSKK